jgi:hypothetical protein
MPDIPPEINLLTKVGIYIKRFKKNYGIDAGTVAAVISLACKANMEHLLNHIKNYYPLSEAAQDALYHSFNKVHLPKK